MSGVGLNINSIVRVRYSAGLVNELTAIIPTGITTLLVVDDWSAARMPRLGSLDLAAIPPY